MSLFVHSISDSDEDNGSKMLQSAPPVLLEQPVKQKQLTKEDRLKLKKEKEVLKIEKKRKAEELKSAKPGECLKYITACIDTNLTLSKYGGELLTALHSSDVEYYIREQRVPFSISWSRRKKADDESVKTADEPELLIIWSCDVFVNAVATNTLRNQIVDIKTITSQEPSVIVYGMEDYFKFRCQKNRINRNMKTQVGYQYSSKMSKNDTALDGAAILKSRSDIESALIELQLYQNTCIRFIDNGSQMASAVCQFSKAVAEKPFKLEKYKTALKSEWFASADGKECVRVDNNCNGLLRLWEQQICQFTGVGLDVAQSIVAADYSSSPALLVQAYDKCSSRKEAEMLLQNIPVRRGYGPLASVRKVGPELSKKMYLMFNASSGDIRLSQE